MDVVSAAQTRFARGVRLPGRVRLSGGCMGRRWYADAGARRPARRVRHVVLDGDQVLEVDPVLETRSSRAHARRAGGRLVRGSGPDKATGRRQDGDARARGHAAVEPGSDAAPGLHVDDPVAYHAGRAEAEREAAAGPGSEGEAEADARRDKARDRPPARSFDDGGGADHRPPRQL
ncbi:MAG: hypothetical protein WCE47_12070, partial [Gaiella sp.]